MRTAKYTALLEYANAQERGVLKADDEGEGNGIWATTYLQEPSFGGISDFADITNRLGNKEGGVNQFARTTKLLLRQEQSGEYRQHSLAADEAGIKELPGDVGKALADIFVRFAFVAPSGDEDGQSENPKI